MSLENRWKAQRIPGQSGYDVSLGQFTGRIRPLHSIVERQLVFESKNLFNAFPCALDFCE